MQRWVGVWKSCGVVLCAGLLLAGCGQDAGPANVPTTAPPSPTSTDTPTTSPDISLVPPTTTRPPGPLPGAGTADVSAPGTTLAHLGAVRLARQEGYDRLVLEFTDQVPGYTVGYRPLPATADGSGAELPLPGAVTSVIVTLNPASAHQEDTGMSTYTGPAIITTDTVQVTQARSAGDFEAVVTWAVGLRMKTPFRVTALTGPPRLVIDFQH